jgi:hypothetical protein
MSAFYSIWGEVLSFVGSKLQYPGFRQYPGYDREKGRHDEQKEYHEIYPAAKNFFPRSTVRSENAPDLFLYVYHDRIRSIPVSLTGRLVLDRFVLLRRHHPDDDRLWGFCSDDPAHKIDYNILWPQRRDITADDVRYCSNKTALGLRTSIGGGSPP